MAAMDSQVQPSINANNHGPQVIIVGGIMLAATVLMIGIACQNRYHAKTLLQVDGLLLLLGAALDITFFAIYAVAVQRRFGQHSDTFHPSEMNDLKKLFLVTMLLFFLSHGVIKISYNMLARHTTRSDNYKRWIDGFSVFIGLWMLSNIVVIAVSIADLTSPKRGFFWTSGIVSILIILGQLFAFLWIIWRTKANIKVKIRWSFSMAIFVPFCITAIIVRMAYTPENYFHGDWTFNDIIQGMLFNIELNLVTMTVLAPNLPVFFKKTSTGGVYFLPGEAAGGTYNSTNLSNSHKSSGNNIALTNKLWRSVDSDGGVYISKGDNVITSTATRASEGEVIKKASFDSDIILMRRSVELERSSAGDHSDR